MIEETIKQILGYVSIGIGTIAAIIIVSGILAGTYNITKIEIKGEEKDKARRKLKQRMGENLLLGLEILIAADIIESIANPSISEVLRLGLVVIIRTFISHFLYKEIKEDA